MILPFLLLAPTTENCLTSRCYSCQKGQETCPDLHVITPHNPGEPKNTLGCAGIVFSWMWVKINWPEPSVCRKVMSIDLWIEYPLIFEFNFKLWNKVIKSIPLKDTHMCYILEQIRQPFLKLHLAINANDKQKHIQIITGCKQDRSYFDSSKQRS